MTGSTSTAAASSHRATGRTRIRYAFLVIMALTALYYAVPAGASAWVIWPCLIGYYYLLARAARRPVRVVAEVPTFLNVEVGFLIFGYMVFLLQYQLYVLSLTRLDRSSFFPAGTNLFVDESNKAVLLSVCALFAFSAGLRHARSLRRPADLTPRPGRSWRSIEPLCVGLLLTLMIAYIAAGWRTAGEGRYTGTVSGGAVAEGVSVVLQMLILVIVGLWVSRIGTRQRPSAILQLGTLIGLGWTVRTLTYGDRNSFLLVATVGLGGILTYRWRAVRMLVVAGVVVSLLLYTAVESLRSSRSDSSAQPYGVDEGDVDSSFFLTTAGLRTALAVVPSQYEYGFGRYKLIGFAGVVPLIRGVVIGDDPSSWNSSAEVITTNLIGDHAGWETGTDLVSDIYLDFGPWAVSPLVYLVGRFAGALEAYSARRRHDSRAVVLYLLMLSTFVQLPRYSLDFPVRIFAWAALLFLAGRVVVPVAGSSDGSTSLQGGRSLR